MILNTEYRTFEQVIILLLEKTPKSMFDIYVLNVLSVLKYVGGKLPIHVRTAQLRRRLFGGAAELLPPGRGDHQLPVAREGDQRQVRHSGRQ